jgi:hypothetical protein
MNTDIQPAAPFFLCASVAVYLVVGGRPRGVKSAACDFFVLKIMAIHECKYELVG